MTQVSQLVLGTYSICKIVPQQWLLKTNTNMTSSCETLTDAVRCRWLAAKANGTWYPDI